MDSEEVPQDNIEMFQGQHKVLYGVKEELYQKMQSSGWEVEEIVNHAAVEECDRLTELALKELKEGLCSPIKYYMYKCRLDLPSLAQNMGSFQWRIKRHFKPEIFKKMSKKRLGKYAEIFDVAAEVLTNA